jgi:hypothetical protein
LQPEGELPFGAARQPRRIASAGAAFFEVKDFCFAFSSFVMADGFFGFEDFCLLWLNACSPEALVVAQRCHYAWRRLLFSASPEKSNQKRGDFFRRSNLFLCRAGLYCKVIPAHTATGAVVVANA